MLGHVADVRKCIDLLVLAARLILLLLIDPLDPLDLLLYYVGPLELADVLSRPRLEPQSFRNFVTVRNIFLTEQCPCAFFAILVEGLKLAGFGIDDVDELIEVGIEFFLGGKHFRYTVMLYQFIFNKSSIMKNEHYCAVVSDARQWVLNMLDL